MGRPTKYKRDYCEMLLTHMADGLSYETFAALLGVSRQTLYDWESKYPDFLDTKKIGEMKSLLYWEKIGRDGLHNETFKDDSGMTVTRSINATIWIFNMKNRFKWRDKSEDEIREENDRPFKDLTDAELMKLRGNGK